MQQVPAEAQERLSQDIIQLVGTELSDNAKALNLGLLLINHVGERVLTDAVAALGDEIRA